MKTMITTAALLFSTFAFGYQPQEALQSVQLNGTGCPVGDYQDYHWEGSELVINFSDMVVTKGAGQKLSNARRNCVVVLDLDRAKAWKYSLDGFAVQGFADVAAGDGLKLSLSGNVQGGAATKSYSFDTLGRSNADFEADVTISPADRVWTPCNLDRALVFNTSALVTNDKAKGSRASESYATLDQIRLRLAFARCS
jgi:hypothetical protein